MRWAATIVARSIAVDLPPERGGCAEDGEWLAHAAQSSGWEEDTH